MNFQLEFTYFEVDSIGVDLTPYIFQRTESIPNGGIRTNLITGTSESFSPVFALNSNEELLTNQGDSNLDTRYISFVRLRHQLSFMKDLALILAKLPVSIEILDLEIIHP